MAIEMAKLSLWLVTLQKDRPFEFLDHAIKWGDSLLGVTSLKQLETFHLYPERGRELFRQMDLLDDVRAAVRGRDPSGEREAAQARGVRRQRHCRCRGERRACMPRPRRRCATSA